MEGFFFNENHSSEMGVIMERNTRGLLPAKRRNDYEIAGRDGTTRYGGETYDTRQISVDICFIEDNVQDLQKKARDVAFWLSGVGILYFDDEPEKVYDAVIYSPVSTEQVIRFRRAKVTFECQPFAHSLNFFQNIYQVSQNSQDLTVTAEGTQPTPCTIIIKNTGTVDITNIEIARRATKV